MSEHAMSEALLSREEMDALLEELSASKRDAEERRRAYGHQAGAGDDGFGAYQGKAESFGEQMSKRLSSTFQRRIEVLTRGCESIDLEIWGDVQAPSDLLWRFCVDGAPIPGFWLLNRPLVFAWLQIAFGGDCARGLPPERRFTPIERRFLESLYSDLHEVAMNFFPAAGVAFDAGNALTSPADLRHLTGVPYVLFSFDVKGFGDVGRARLGFPQSALRPKRNASPSGAVSEGVAQPPRTRPLLLDAPVTLRAVAGGAEISLERLAALRPGDTLAIEGAQDGSLLINVEGSPKFRALRGARGGRLAFQITETLRKGEVGYGGS